MLVKSLRKTGNADVVIIFAYVILLAVMGGAMFVGGLASQVKGEEDSSEPSWVYRALQRLPMRTRFPASGIETSALAPLALGIVVGILSALMGGGGGFFLIPAMTFCLAMPMRVVVGTSLFQMLFTAASVTILQAAVNDAVDVFLAVGLLAGSVLGAQAGAWAATRLKGTQLKIVLALLVLALSVKMFNDLLVVPGHFLADVRGLP